MGVGETTNDLYARGQAAWPELAVDRDAYAAIAERALRDDPSAELAAEDLYLAQACVTGAAAALAAFDTTCGPTIHHSLRAMGLRDDVIADITQDVRAKLFVDGKVASYSGRAALKSWVRTIATRAAVDRLRKPASETASDEMLAALPDAAAGPELDHFRTRYQNEFKEAFEAALGSLEVRERNVLRHHFIDRLAFEDIGALYGVHKTTAFRWLEDARDKLSKRTKNHFQDRVKLSPSEMESVLRLLQSNIDLSLSRVLG